MGAQCNKVISAVQGKTRKIFFLKKSRWKETNSQTHHDLKDLLAQACARLADLEVTAEELEAELVSPQDTEDRVSDLLQNAADGCPSVLVSSISSRG